MSKWQCEQCDQQFGSKQSMMYHINHNVCGMKNVCVLCDKSFSSKQKLNYHVAQNVCVKRTKPKIVIKAKQVIPSVIDYETYTKAQLINELLSTKGENKALKENPQIINNNVSNVNNISITVAPPLSMTDNYEQMISHHPKLLHTALSQHPANFISYMIKEINCNPERPIYNSVKITNKRDNYAQVSDGTKYVHTTKRKIITELIDNKRSQLQEYIDNNGDKYGVKILKRYQDYVDALDDDKKLQKELEDDIICMLLDVSDIIGSEDWSKKLLEDLKVWEKKDDNESDITK
jgi:hypothetical protein